MRTHKSVNLSGDRFRVWYKIQGNEGLARKRAHALCVEQTVEFPADLLPPGDIPEVILGQIANIEELSEESFEVEITYPIEITGFELPQFLNVLFGNSSIKPGIRVERFKLPASLSGAFRGPRFGRDGLRTYLGVEERPLLCTALKPMGLDVQELAELAYQFALGGIDIIKDDHGLANQGFSPFAERVELCSAAVQRANGETGYKAIYMPNVTGPVETMHSHAKLAKDMGAGGLLVSPGLSGFDLMRFLADDDSLSLPIMCHPALLGSFVTNPEIGISHYLLFGQIVRLAGGDATIYPNFGGRFSFSLDECNHIVAGTEVDMGEIKPIFPTPGGGMSLERIPGMIEIMGNDLICLIGGDLHRHGDPLALSARKFRALVEIR